MNTPFAKGHHPEDLDAALLAPPAEQDAAFRAINATAKLADPRYGLRASIFGGVPHADDSPQIAAALGEVVLAAVRYIDTDWRSLREAVQRDGNPLEGLDDVLGGPTAPASLFRMVKQSSPEPWVSQLMILPITAGSVSFEQRHRQRTGAYGTTAEAQAAMLAGTPIETQTYGAELYINTPRTLGSAVHQDPPYWLPLHAAILLDNLRVPVSSLFPPLPAERGFISYGGPAHLHCTLAKAVEAALAECWRVKWAHRARRPEELLADQGSLHSLWHERFAPLLEPWGGRMPFPIVEGSPMHPTWPAGHPTIAGAAATVMKAFRANGPWPVARAAALLAAAGHNIPGGIAQASPDGTRLFPANTNPPPVLTVHGEIDRGAWGMGFGRLPLGVHMRDDVTQGLLLGQAAAVEVLQRERDEAAALGLAPWGTTTFQGFGGQLITI